MDIQTVAQYGLPAAAGVIAYLFSRWWRPPGPQETPPLLAM